MQDRQLSSFVSQRRALIAYCLYDVDFFQKLKDEEEGGRTIWQNGNYPLHLLFKTDLQNPVCLVDDQGFQIPEYEPFRVLQTRTKSVTGMHNFEYRIHLEVIQQTTWSCDQQIYALYQLLCFRPPICTPDDNAKRLCVMSHQILRNSEYL